jgi:hypothetical protein
LLLSISSQPSSRPSADDRHHSGEGSTFLGFGLLQADRVFPLPVYGEVLDNILVAFRKDKFAEEGVAIIGPAGNWAFLKRAKMLILR